MVVVGRLELVVVVVGEGETPAADVTTAATAAATDVFLEGIIVSLV